jgi:iron(III) transport system permease protein
MADTTIQSPAAPAARLVRPVAGAEEWTQRLLILLLGGWLLLTVVFPLSALLRKAAEDREGRFIGLANFAAYFNDPAMVQSLYNTLSVALISTVITILLAFGFAYAITRSAIPFQSLFRSIAMVPLLAPSLLPGLALIYLFGNQGILKGWLFGHSIYGPIGIVLGEVFFALPHAVMIIVTALSAADQRLYEAAESLRAKPLRIFWTVTLPGCRYGLVSATFVVFTLVFTDFGVPKVIGGQFNVLATDVYRQVIGQFNFQMGAVVGLLLLAPAILSFAVDRMVQRKQVALLSARAVPYQPQRRPAVDAACFVLCALVSIFVLSILGMAVFGSLITFWPYNLSLTLSKYNLGALGTVGWDALWNSLIMASLVAFVGTIVVFSGAYLVEKTKTWPLARSAVHLGAMIPLAVPGLVLGLAYIFFFNAPGNPLNFIYATIAILVVNTVAHFYTVCHLTAVTALKQVDNEFEAVSASLKVPFYTTFWRVTVPVCLPAILDIAAYYFINAMTTVSAVIFLYSSDTKLLSIAAVNTDDAGNTAVACAMGTMIVLVSAAARVVQLLAARMLHARTQAWRRR